MIVDQHARVRQLFHDIDQAQPADRSALFEDLVSLVSIHEAVEEEVVHPAVRPVSDKARRVIEARAAEADAAKETLANLQGMDASTPEFMVALDLFRRDVETHAAREEVQILPFLAAMPPDRLAELASAMRMSAVPSAIAGGEAGKAPETPVHAEDRGHAHPR